MNFRANMAIELTALFALSSGHAEYSREPVPNLSHAQS